MRFLGRKFCVSVVLVALAGLVGISTAAGQSYQGRQVAGVLRELRLAGLALIYNDELVPASLRVLTEPRGDDVLARLRSILVPHGLELRAVGGSTWAIVPATAAQATIRETAQPTSVEEIVVTTSRYALIRPETATVTSQSGAELASLPRLADEPLRAVHRLPAAASNGLSGLAHIRGGEENESGIFLDGLPLLEPFHLKNFFGPVSVLDASIIGSMDIYAGGFPARFGDYMSAALDIVSVNPPEDGMGELGLSLFHSNVVGGGQFSEGRGRWLLAGRRSNITEVLNLLDSSFGEPRYLDSFGKIEFDLNTDTTVGLRYLVADDQLELQPSDEEEYSRVRDRTTYVWATLGHRWSDRYSGSAVVSYTEIDNNRIGWVNEPPEQVASVDDRRNYNVAALRLGFERAMEDLHTSMGLDIAQLDSTYRYDSQTTIADDTSSPGSPASVVSRSSQLGPDGYRLGMFVSNRWRIADRLTGEFGLRWDDRSYDEINGGLQLSPRLNVLYEIDSASRLRAGWGRFFQSQSINSVQVEDGIENFWPAQRADHWIVSAEHDFSNGVGLRTEAYLKDYARLKPRFENLYDPLVLIPELEPDRVGIDPSTGRVRGIEVMLNQRSDEYWNWWLSYGWSRAEERIDGQEFLRSWDQRHTFGAGFHWTRSPWELTVAGTYHTGWPTTRATLGEPDPVGSPPPIENGTRNSDRLGSFRSLDFRLSRSFPLENSELRAFIEIINVLSQSNPCCVDDDVVQLDSGEYTLVREYDVWPRIVPNVGIAWKF